MKFLIILLNILFITEQRGSYDKLLSLDINGVDSVAYYINKNATELFYMDTFVINGERDRQAMAFINLCFVLDSIKTLNIDKELEFWRNSNDTKYDYDWPMVLFEINKKIGK